MKRFASFDEYKEILGRYSRSSVYKNVYYLKPQVQRLIAEQALSYEETGNNLYLYETCEGFYRFCYCVTDIHEYAPVRTGMPAVIEYVYMNEMNEKQQAETEYLNKIGFSLKRHGLRMVLDHLSDFKFRDVEYEKMGITIRYAEEKDIPEIRNILLVNFDPKYSYIPTVKELPGIIGEKRILIALYKDEVIGVNHFEIAGKVCRGWQTAVKPGHTMKGIGWMLFNQRHHVVSGRAERCLTWVDSVNPRAWKMYQSSGYRFDGRCADEYVCSGNEE